jgi:FkbM family methyltransferase
MARLLKRIASRLPPSWQLELKRLHFRRQIRNRTFDAPDPEFVILDHLVASGDWAVDVGANVGHYTKRLSDLVGPEGRVVALEPIPETFSLLAANVALFRYPNVTLLNMAASDRTDVSGVAIPTLATGLKNYYGATLVAGESTLRVVTVALDALAFPHRIRLAKIDAEGHDAAVLRGMERLLARDHPTLIVETDTPDSVAWLAGLGYRGERLAGSPNRLYTWLPPERGGGGR